MTHVQEVFPGLGKYSDDLQLCSGDTSCSAVFQQARSAGGQDYFAGKVEEAPDSVLTVLALAAQRQRTLGLRKVVARYADRVTVLSGGRISGGRYYTAGENAVLNPVEYLYDSDFVEARVAKVDTKGGTSLDVVNTPEVSAAIASAAKSSSWWIVGGAVSAVVILFLGR